MTLADLTPDERAAFLAFAARLGYPDPEADPELCRALLETWHTWERHRPPTSVNSRS